MGRKDAAACYRELGAGLRKCREAAGLTARQITRRTGWSQSKVSRVESGHAGIDLMDLTWYLGVCRVRHEDAVPLIDLCRRAKSDKGYWLSSHGQWVPDTLSSLIYHESTAQLMTNYEPMVVPGLLQTESYARAMIDREQWRTKAQIDASVHIRLDRQKVLSRRSSRFVFYLHEQALRLEVGGSEVMHEQMIVLALAGAVPNVEVRVVPAAAGARSYFGQDFFLLQYAQHGPLVYLGGPVTAMFLEDREYVATYRGLTNELAAVAVGGEESREFIAALADEYDRGSRPDGVDRVEEELL